MTKMNKKIIEAQIEQLLKEYKSLADTILCIKWRDRNKEDPYKIDIKNMEPNEKEKKIKIIKWIINRLDKYTNTIEILINKTERNEND